tara:strand:- start:3061 stop:4794 length:1734 start_codon:yes stop_codon:yes gene_type:complete
MELTYKKNDNTELFKSFEDLDILNMTNLQNYSPIYGKFFALTDTNYNSINLNNKFYLNKVLSKPDEKTFIASLNNKLEKEVFFKLSPILEPIKYLSGKYDNYDETLFTLPKLCDKDTNKVNNVNNSAYVDSFASYLTSQLLHSHGFLHGIDFYGSYIGIKNNFDVNIYDDLEYLYENPFFQKNQGELFILDNVLQEDIEYNSSRNYKKPLNVNEEINPEILTLSDIKDLSELDSLFSNENNDNSLKPEVLFSSDKIKDTNLNWSRGRSSTTCSSRTSITRSDETCSEKSMNSGSASGSGSYTGSGTGSYTGSGTGSYTGSISSDEYINAQIKKFPIQIISLEKCENTFDYLLVNDKLSDRELSSAIFQIIMSLIVIQKVFHMTHNDLHTNNIMYISTKEKFLYYKFNDKQYKVPTFGRIYKIIDFGRAIYKYKGKFMCSDSFHSKGDAATQYNIEPFFNEKKPRLEPNFSFDLCRLGCSMYDFFVEDINNDKKGCSEIQRIIIDWCYDDKKRNILYKTNGNERYPEFKLYKMIVRTVHRLVPSEIINLPYFSKYYVKKKEAFKCKHLMNIDEYPVYT